MKINPIIPFTVAALALSPMSLNAADDGHGHGHGGSAVHEAHADHMLEGYAVVAAGLFEDDLAAAQKAAAGMVKHDKNSAMAKHAQAITDSKSLAEARKHFDALSKVAIPVAKKQKVMHVAHCPMAMDGKGADWLQEKNDEIKNPYMGQKMPKCGKFME